MNLFHIIIAGFWKCKLTDITRFSCLDERPTNHKRVKQRRRKGKIVKTYVLFRNLAHEEEKGLSKQF